jgi:hypothetical protein
MDPDHFWKPDPHPFQSEKPGAVETYSGILDAHHGDVEVHNGAEEAHSGALKGLIRWLQL